jgi:competence ComEA-like helix-hairpin-helix protein
MIWKIFFIFLILIGNISALCEENQININSASTKELDKLSGIGEVKAQAIVDSRFFNSIDDLIDVYGIGEITLQKIKDQGLACVENAEEKENEIEIIEFVEKKEIEEEKDIQQEFITENEKKSKIINSEIIKLNSKDIKSEDTENSYKTNYYAKYGFVIFCILLGFLFIIKNKSRYNKNEFG